MENNLSNSIKYPKSNNGNQCIAPCYEPGTKVVHPVTLELVTHKNLPFCPTDQWTFEDPDTGNKTQLIMDICMNPTKNNNSVVEEDDFNILIPQFNFNVEFFLKYYYGLKSFDDSINWLEANQQLPFYTRLRVFNSAFIIWGTTEQFIITENLIKFYKKILKKMWIKDFYQSLSKFVIIKNKKISFGDPKLSDDKDKNVVEKTNFILEKAFTDDVIYKLLMKYNAKYFPNWENISEHHIELKTFSLNHIKKKLLETINKL
jgi:hypothetical protein